MTKSNVKVHTQSTHQWGFYFFQMAKKRSKRLTLVRQSRRTCMPRPRSRENCEVCIHSCESIPTVVSWPGVRLNINSEKGRKSDIRRKARAQKRSSHFRNGEIEITAWRVWRGRVDGNLRSRSLVEPSRFTNKCGAHAELRGPSLLTWLSAESLCELLLAGTVAAGRFRQPGVSAAGRWHSRLCLLSKQGYVSIVLHVPKRFPHT